MATLFIPAGSTNYTLVGTANDILDATTGGGHNILKAGTGDNQLFAYTNDTLYGGTGNDQLYSDGNGGNILYAGTGNDIIFANHNDTVFGGVGNDTIFGGIGGNTIIGGSGKNTFWLANTDYPSSPNIITNFDPTKDNLQVNVDGITTANQLTFTQQDGNTLVSVNSRQLAILYELQKFSIASASATQGNAINFTITRTGNTQLSQSVTVSTSINQDDTASDNDFTAKNETITFSQGETTKTFSVQTTQDSLVDENETFTVALSNPTNGAVVSPTNSTTKGTIINDNIPLANFTKNDIFTIKGANNQVRLKVSLVERNSNFVNELGVFNVDDAQGNINGIAPGAAGYNQAALNRAKVVFSAISNLPNGLNTVDFTRLINFNSGDNLKFFLVKNGTIDSVNSGKTPLSNLLFADALNQKITDLGTNGFNLYWKDGSGKANDFNDLVVNVQSTNDKLVLGTGLQGGNQGEVIDLRDTKGQIKADFSVHREAAFNDEVYFYKIDSNDGQIGNLQANSVNSANYLQAALNNLMKDVKTGANIKFATTNQHTQTGTITINGGTILAPMLVVNGTLSQLLDKNSNHHPQVYFPYLGVNSDGVDHVRLLGNNTFAFEDLPKGGDFDYNDVVVKMNFTAIAA